MSRKSRANKRRIEFFRQFGDDKPEQKAKEAPKPEKVIVVPIMEAQPKLPRPHKALGL